METEEKISRKEAIHELWNRGSLQYFLKGKQIELYKAMKDETQHINVVLASRRWGKSTVLSLLAIETCLRKPNSVVKYIAPTKVQVQEILDSVMKPILEDCPKHLFPEWKEAKKRFVFPNGSTIQIWATDGGHADSIRGGVAHLGIIDEAGYADKLGYVIDNVLSPATDTVGGHIILASTPNYNDPNHEFNIDYVLPRQELGTLKKFTIYDAPMIDDKRRQEIIDRYGIDNPKFKTEYLCELQVDPEKLVLSEFMEKEAEIVREVERAVFFNTYVSFDIGFKDLSGVLFAWFDFKNSTIVIEDEIVINGPELTTDYLAELIRKKEAEHFRNHKNVQIPPSIRVADNNNPILLNDLYRLHGIMFVPTAKDNKDAQINELKMRLKQGRIAIHPRCVNLRYHLRAAKWNKKRDGFDRIKEDRHTGFKANHADLLDALLYLVRNVQTYLNPYPDSYGQLMGENVYGKPEQYQGAATSFGKTIQKMLNIKSGKISRRL